MSGHKRTTVTISQEEYRRLYDAERKNYYQSFELSENTLLPLIQESQSNLYSNYQNIAERQAYYEQVIDSFQNQVQEVETASAKSLVDQQIDFYNQLLTSSEQLWQDTSYVLQSHTQEFEQNVQSQHNKLLQQLNQYETRLTNFSSRIDRIQAAAENWLNDVLNLYEFIHSSYPDELKDHNYLASIHQQINYGSVNYENGFYEASLSTSQQVFSNLSSYRLTLEQNYAHFQAIHQSIQDRLLLIRDQCISNNVVQAIGMDGELLDEYIDIDYWNENQRLKLVENIDHLLRKLNEQGNWCNDSILRNLNETEIPQLMNRYSENIQESRRKALNAQLRYNTAQLVMVSLIQQGYKPEYGQFNEDDQRSGYLASAVAPDGSSVIIKVDPTTDLTSQLEIITSHSHLITETEMKRKALEIMQSVEPYGLMIGKIEEVHTPQKTSKLPARVKQSQAQSLSHKMK